MRWCILLGLVAMTVSMSAIDEQSQNHQFNYHNTSDINPPAAEIDPHQQQDEVETSTEEFLEDDYYLDDEESEFLPDPEALVDGQEEEEVVVLDDETRIVAEQLIQELDHIGNKLQDDQETLASSRSVSTAEVKKLERLLESAGLTPSSPLLQVLMQQRQDAIPASALGPGMDGMSGLSSLLGGASPVGAVGSSSFIAPGSMTKKNVEEIKVELKHMLFGPDQNTRRRQGNSGRPGRPISTSHLHYSDTAARRPIPPPRYRPQEKSSKKRTRLGNRRKAQNRQQVSSKQSQRPPIPLFLRPPRPARPGLNQQSKNIPAASPNVGGRPIHNDLPRQPINEFRPQASDFRLPEAPFRQQIATTNFAQPSRSAANNNANIPAAVRGQVSTPVQQREQTRPFSPSPPVPRPSEDQFRPALLGGNRPQQVPPRQFVQASQPPVRTIPQQTTVLGAQQRQPITNSQLPVKPQLGRPISSPPANFAPAPNPSVTLSTANRNKPIQPECNLFSEGICLDVRNYPTELISNYLNRNKPALENMLAEVRSQSADDLVDGITSAEERRYSYNHYYGSRRQGEDTHAHRDFAEDGGFLCPSEVKYARPQLAQTSRGVWKYIINMAEHTQTIRMERCLKPSSGCSYVSPHYKSHCIQVYNYHRLLSFEESKGMHVDIYKIPVGCSCHVQGYAYLYPPLDGKVAGHIIPPAFPTENSNGGNSLGSNRKTSANREPVNLAPPRDVEERPESRDEVYPPDSGFSVPSGMKEFSSFMDQQFGGNFNPFSNNKGGSIRRTDDYGIDERDQQPMESNPENTGKNARRRPLSSRTNYDYHPIIDFFNDKP